MSKTSILFVQGGGAGTHDAWDNKLVESLRTEIGNGFEIRYPLMPKEDDPNYLKWKTTIEKEFASPKDRIIVVAHSIGGTILINALADGMTIKTLAGVFLIAAPFVGDGGWPSEEISSMADIGSRLTHAAPIYLYHGTNDDIAPVAHLDLYKKAIPKAIIRKLKGRDHQLNNDLSEVARDIQALHQG